MSTPADPFSSARRELLALMGVSVWKPRSSTNPPPGEDRVAPAAAAGPAAASASQSRQPPGVEPGLAPPAPAARTRSSSARDRQGVEPALTPPAPAARIRSSSARDRQEVEPALTPPAPAARIRSSSARDRQGVEPGPIPPAPAASAPPPELEALRSEVAACTACPLHAGRRQTVFGVGNPKADWMFVGEGPGEEEDRRGEPFVGRAGKLLDAMLRAMQLDRNTVYIANIVKCRPPNNRNPSLEEAASCIPYLRRQIELVAPRLIVALGAVAAQRLLETNRPVGALRGQLHHAAELAPPVLVTYHPAYLLRSPGQKRKAWEDLQLAMREMAAFESAQDAV